jgi:hypothetical protein
MGTGWWALFDGDDEQYGHGVYDRYDYAENDLYGRPDDVRVADACTCTGGVRLATECPVCAKSVEEDA